MHSLNNLCQTGKAVGCLQKICQQSWFYLQKYSNGYFIVEKDFHRKLFFKYFIFQNSRKRSVLFFSLHQSWSFMLERKWENTFPFIRNLTKKKPQNFVNICRQNVCSKVKIKGKGLRDLNILQNKNGYLNIYESSIFKIKVVQNS